MSETTLTPKQSHLLNICLLLTLLLSFFMPSGESLWIDEANEMPYVWAEDWEQWWGNLTSDDKSTAQMPLAMACRRLAASLIGSGEWQLRLANLPWVWLGLFSAWGFARLSGAWIVLPLFFLHPFLWFYANEARPYAMTIGLSALFASAASTFLLKRDLTALWVAAAAGILLIYANILAIFLLVGAAIVFSLLWLRGEFRWLNWTKVIPGLLLSLLAALPALIYQSWTILKDAGGKKVMVTQVGLPNLAFSIYEFIGLAGLGPDRTALREAVNAGGPASAFPLVLPYAVPIALFTLCLAFILFTRSVYWRELSGNKLICFLLLLTGTTVSLVVVAALIKNTSFWGRHLACAFPLAIFLLGCICAHKAPPRLRLLSGLAIGGLLSCLAYSSWQVRFDPRFAKDDYRNAAAAALEVLADNGVVWWAADPHAARYYGLPITKDDSLIFDLRNANTSHLETLAPPSLVVISKSDIYDARGDLNRWLKTNDFKASTTFPAFRLYQRE